MKVTLTNGVLRLVSEDGRIFADRLSALATQFGTHWDLVTIPAEGAWHLDGNRAYCDNFTLEFRPEGDGMLVRGRFRNTTSKPLTDMEAIHFLTFDVTDKPRKAFLTRFFRIAGNAISDMRSSVDTLVPVPGARYDSPDFVAFTTDTGSTVCGFVTFREYFGGITLTGEGHLALYQYMERRTIAPNEVIVSDWMCVTPRGDMVTDALPYYAETVLSLSGGKRPSIPPPVGYCSWYYYGGTLTDGMMRDNMEFFDEHRDDLPIDVVQADAGWYALWGDAVPLDRFMNGDMKAFADEVKASGRIPGIWIAPLGIDANSELYRTHPEYTVKNRDGGDWNDPFLCLDLSVEGAQKYVADLFRTLSYEWGYRYIKFDIVADTLGAGVFRDPRWSPLKNYRKLLELIRENVTEDTYLLACTVPLNASAGLTDGLRVSCDIFERWDSVRDVFNPSLKRYFMHGVWFNNDADCLLVRTADEEDEQCFRPCTRTKTEIRTFVTAMAATGGALIYSDKMPLLKEWQIEMLTKLYPLNRRAALPLDLMDSFIPGVLDFGVRHGIRTVALINWDDAPRTLSVPDSRGKLAFEFWTQTFLGEMQTDLSLEIEPHDCRVCFFSEPGDCVLVGTDASIVMDVTDGKKNKKNETLTYAERTADGYRVTKK